MTRAIGAHYAYILTIFTGLFSVESMSKFYPNNVVAYANIFATRYDLRTLIC
jgi:hypothetical protein